MGQRAIANVREMLVKFLDKCWSPSQTTIKASVFLGGFVCAFFTSTES
jgi:hypothetical protein